MFRPARILVPIDFSDSSQPAVAYARDLARVFGSQVHLLHVMPIPVTQGWGERAPAGKLEARAEEWRRDVMSELTAFAGEHGGGNCPTYLAVARSSDPADSIVSYAIEEGCNLIVMGTHRLSALTGLMRGSTSERVRRRASCPVMLLPPAASTPSQPCRPRELERVAS